jgi:hypothetical protein
MSSKGLGEMFKGDSADTCGGKFPLMSMGSRVEGLACTDLGACCHIYWEKRTFKSNDLYRVIYLILGI